MAGDFQARRSPRPAPTPTTAWARRLWRLLEPYHAIVYFSTETRDAYQQAGLRGFWMGYFAGRAAPMGEVGPGLVTATFYNFSPRMVNRSLPDAWGFATPSQVIEARLAGVDAALTRVLGDVRSTGTLAGAGTLAVEAARAAGPAGRPLYSANADLHVPEAAHLRLWWAATCLREHRGDGHVATLVNADIDGCEAHVLQVAGGAIPRPVLQDNRGWTDDEWSLAEDRLHGRGLVGSDGALTTAGRALRRDIEHDTDRLADEPYRRLGEVRTEELATLLKPVTTAILGSGVIPMPNPIGLPPG